jgi:feruloyl-CoA synthase
MTDAAPVTQARYRAAPVGGCIDAIVTRRVDGAWCLRSREALQPYPERLTDCLDRWADEAPERVFVAKREQGGDWRRIRYAEMRRRARSVGQALLDLGLSVERPLAVLSENDLEHLTLALGAMYAGVPYAPISPAYSLVSRDYAKLRHIVAKLTPGLVFAADGAAFSRAINAAVPADIELALGAGKVEGRGARLFADLIEGEAGAGLASACARVGPDSIAKLLFTSGSTRQPKGVATTHRMLCANQQMLRQSLAFLADEPPVLVDWLPWNHTFGGSHNVGIALYNGGTFYIDEGKPTPQGIGETLRNLREISPTVYFNVPKGFEEIAAAMEGDALLRQSLFRRVQAFFFAGAGLSQAVWDQLDRLGEQTVGERIPVMTGLGMTETAPSCTFALKPGIASGHIGLPCPGVEVKLVPTGNKCEIRFRGPNVMPGYWREAELTAEAFDEEGYYRTGDAARFADPADAQRGLLFDGRIAEDFKLSTGTFVSVGPLRARIIAAGAPCVQDVVVTGVNRGDVGMLIFPRLDACRKLAGNPDGTPAEVLQAAALREFFQRLTDRLWREGTGSANRIARAHVLLEPPSIDRGEVTDKGSINQGAVLSHRAALVDALYASHAAACGVILPHQD